MRVVMLTADYLDCNFGGVEWHVYNLASALLRADVEVLVVRTGHRPVRFTVPTDVPFRVNDRRRRVRHDPFPAIHTPAAVNTGLQFARRVTVGAMSYFDEPAIARLLESADVVHQHDFVEGWGRTRRAAGHVPIVWTNHLGEFLKLRGAPGGQTLLRLLTRHYSAAIGPSRELADGRFITPPVNYIPNGVDVRRHHPVDLVTRRALRRTLGWGDEPVVIVPRRWAPTKGVVYAAEALASPIWPTETRVVFAGAGVSDYPGYVDLVRGQLRSARCAVEVHDYLPIETMTEALAVADICVIPSLEEATSLSALEALASGVPVVATDVGGLPEIIADGRNGKLVRPQDSTALARAVREILDLPSGDRSALSERSTAMAQEHSWDAVAAQTLAVYESVT